MWMTKAGLWWFSAACSPNVAFAGGHGMLRRPFDDLTLLAGTVTSALLGNAFICAVISGPHDRYGARLAWLATTVVLIAAIRHFSGDDESRDRSLPA